MWTIYANCTPAQVGQFLVALDQELSRLLKEPITAREIEDAKSHLVGSMILSQEDMETRMKRMVRQHMMMGRVLSFQESVDALRAVGDPAVEQYARQCLRGEAFSLLAYGSRRISGMRGFDFSFARADAQAARARGAPRRAGHP